jgi:flagellar basal-body rod modification protein FlgD
MTVPPVTGSNGSGSTTNSVPAPTVDYQSFLKLLIAEMKNQDPTKPMDSTEYVAQLATFSQVEQSVQTNSKLDQLLQTSALAQAGNVIGHTVTSADGDTSGTVSSVRLTSDGLVAVLATGEEVTMQSGVVIQ